MRMTIVLLSTTILQSLAAQGGTLEMPVRCLEPDWTTGTSKAVIVEDISLVHTAQILPFDEQQEIVTGGLSNQTERVLALLRGLLSSGRSDLATAVKLNVYISTSNDMPVVLQALAREFFHANKPAATFVVTPLPEPAAQIGR